MSLPKRIGEKRRWRNPTVDFWEENRGQSGLIDLASGRKILASRGFRTLKLAQVNGIGMDLLNSINVLHVFEAVCWILLFYTWIAYPMILWVVNRIRCRYRTYCANLKLSVNVDPENNCLKNQNSGLKFKDLAKNADALPKVSVLIAAHNEEEIIGPRIRNLMELEYPGDKLSVFIGSDGSTDQTVNISKFWASRHNRIHVLEASKRRGKMAILKRLVALSEDEIVVFSDANTLFNCDALILLVSHMKDSKIGGVCGRLELQGEGEHNRYWRMEARLKIMESDLDSCLGANGSIYAIRKRLFWKDVPDNTIVDDFVIGMKVREQGLRMVYEPLAIAKEEMPPSAHEWIRRERIGSGDYQALGLCKRCLLPQYGKFAWMFWSHKVLRWFTPHILLALLTVSVFSLGFCFLNDSSLPLDIQVVLCSFSPILLSGMLICGLVGRVIRNTGFARTGFLNPLRVCDEFIRMQAGLFIGFIHFCRGNLKGHWARTPRD